MARLVRTIWYTNWRPGPDIGAGQKGVYRLRGTIDQIEFVVDSRASVARHGGVSGFARDLLIRPVGYADRRMRPYICAGEEAIGGLDCTFHKVVLGFNR